MDAEALAVAVGDAVPVEVLPLGLGCAPSGAHATRVTARAAAKTAVTAGAIVRRARAINPRLLIVARAHSDEEVADLLRRGADHVVMAERETASRMAERAMLARA